MGPQHKFEKELKRKNNISDKVLAFVPNGLNHIMFIKGCKCRANSSPIASETFDLL